MNTVDGGGAKAVAVVDDGDGVDGGVFLLFFFSPFLWRFDGCFMLFRS